MSRDQLLTAMECRPEEWPNRSAALFMVWEERPSETAAKIAEGVTNGD